MNKFLYMQAPMEDVTDTAMRRLVYDNGADITFTEMARFESLARKNKSTIKKTDLKDDTPTWIQIIGSKENQLKKYLKDFVPKKGFLGFNFNFGCPSPEMINHGLGCAMIRRISKTKRLLKIVEDFGYKNSVKLRLGLNNAEKRNLVYLNLINEIDTEFFIVHSRIGSDDYFAIPDHKVLEACTATGKMIIANGDINTLEKVEEVKNYGVKGVMIGRAAICNPAIFSKLKGQKSKSIEQLKLDYENLTKKFLTPKNYKKNVLTYLGRDPINNTTKAND